MQRADDLSCQGFVELVTDYLAGVLPADVRERFEAHLRLCDGCELYLAQMRLAVRALSQQRITPLSAATRAELAAQFAASHASPKRYSGSSWSTKRSN